MTITVTRYNYKKIRGIRKEVKREEWLYELSQLIREIRR